MEKATKPGARNENVILMKVMENNGNGNRLVGGGGIGMGNNGTGTGSSSSGCSGGDGPYIVCDLSFAEESIRRQFLRKVYLILMAQLIVTMGLLSFFMYNETVKEYIMWNPIIFWLSFIVLVITMIIMVGCDSVRRETPKNFIFLGIFTIAESFLLGTIVTQFAPEEIFFAIGITAVLCFALSLYALQSNTDFTVMGGTLLISFILLLVLGLVLIFVPSKIMVMLYSSIGAFLFSIYLIYDTQLMIGGKHKYSLSPEEYIFAALNLYLDIINVFLYMLSFIGSSR